MRRTLKLALALTLLAVAFDWAPGVPPFPIHGAAAQPLPITPGGTIVWSNASESCVNTASECQVFQYTVPAALIASFTNPLANVSQWLDGRTANGLNTPVLWTVPQPLHLSMAGLNAGTSGSIQQFGINLGGTAASLSLQNTLTSTQGLEPIQLDVYIIPIASSNATPTSTNNSVWLMARLTRGAAAGNTATITTTQTLAAMNNASAAQLNVLSRWSSGGSNANTIIWLKRVLKIGE